MASARGSADAAGWATRQQAASGSGSEQDRAAGVPQHEAEGFAGSRPARRSSAASSAGFTPWARAQARVSAGVLQQQLVKHCSAVVHPHGLSMQGNGVERSLA